MTRRCGILLSPPLAALALLLLLGFSQCAAAARLLPAATTTAPHQDTGVANVKAADAASDKLVALHTEGDNKVGNGGEAVWETTAAAEEGEGEEACEEGTDGGEECMQRRLLHDAHLDYIYTQHKGRP